MSEQLQWRSCTCCNALTMNVGECDDCCAKFKPNPRLCFICGEDASPKRGYICEECYQADIVVPKEASDEANNTD